ncbi:unnamed protein product, partial [Ectocarpus sp. 12 AP-2014]
MWFLSRGSLLAPYIVSPTEPTTGVCLSPLHSRMYVQYVSRSTHAWRETRSKIVSYIMSARSAISLTCCPRLQDLESQGTLDPHERMWIPTLVRLSGNYTVTRIF